MAFNKNTIKTLVKTRLSTIATEVKTAFQNGKHLSEDAVNDKIATAIADAFQQFIQDAQVQIPTHTLTAPPQATLTTTAGPVTGTIIIPQQQGTIT